MEKRKNNNLLLLLDLLDLLIILSLLVSLFKNSQELIIEVDHPYIVVNNENLEVESNISNEQLNEMLHLSNTCGLKKVWNLKTMTKDDFSWDFMISARWSESDQIKMNYDILIGEKKSYICICDMFINPDIKENPAYIRVYAIKDSQLFLESVHELLNK